MLARGVREGEGREMEGETWIVTKGTGQGGRFLFCDRWDVRGEGKLEACVIHEL